MRKKIVPPVTPRIVQANPGQRYIWIALLLLALLITAWFSYDYGRNQVQAPPLGGEAPAIDSARWQQQRVTTLEEERDTLKQQVAEMKHSLEQANRALGAAQSRNRALQKTTTSRQVLSAAPPTPRPDPEPAAAPTASPVPATVAADYTLKLDNMDIEPTESADTFMLRFSVSHGAENSARVTGNIWIAVNGMTRGKPKRLSLKILSPQRRPYVKMGFDQQQEVTEKLVLPEDFSPKNILIEAKPYGDKFKGTSEKFDWYASG